MFDDVDGRPRGRPCTADSLPPVCAWYQLQKSAAVDERFYNEQQAPSRTPKSHFVLAPLIGL